MAPERPDTSTQKRIDELSSGNELFDDRVIEQWEGLRPKVNAFGGVYSDTMLREDEEFIRSRESEWRTRPRSSIRLEYLILDGIYSRNWLGQNTEVVPASRYDDVKNGIDIVVRFQREDGSDLFVGIDVTSTDDRMVIKRKIMRTVGDLEHGHSPMVKYYSGDQPEPRGRVFLPRIVIGTDHENVQGLFDDFVAGLEKKEEMQSIDRHPLQLGLIRQMRKQLVIYTEKAVDAFLHFRSRANRGDSQIRKIEMLLDTLRPMAPSEEIDDPTWKTFLAMIEGLRSTICERGGDLGTTIFAHIDLFQELTALEKERRSNGIVAEGARAGTEEYLEDPDKSYAIAA